ncbi:hypothetical protein D3C87_1147290 [compost metagenome]
MLNATIAALLAHGFVSTSSVRQDLRRCTFGLGATPKRGARASASPQALPPLPQTPRRFAASFIGGSSAGKPFNMMSHTPQYEIFIRFTHWLRSNGVVVHKIGPFHSAHAHVCTIDTDLNLTAVVRRCI